MRDLAERLRGRAMPHAAKAQLTKKPVADISGGHPRGAPVTRSRSLTTEKFVHRKRFFARDLFSAVRSLHTGSSREPSDSFGTGGPARAPSLVAGELLEHIDELAAAMHLALAIDVPDVRLESGFRHP